MLIHATVRTGITAFYVITVIYMLNRQNMFNYKTFSIFTRDVYVRGVCRGA